MFNLDYRYFCRPNCTKDYPYEILYEQKCVKFCDYKYLKDKSCLLNYIEEKEKTEIEPGYKKISKREEQIKMYNIILDNTELSFTSESINTSDLEGGENVIFEFDEMKIILTTTKNQEEDNINNITIDLGEYEDLLRKTYDILNDQIFMKIIEVKQEGMKIPKIQFKVYSKLNSSNLIKLNLSYCKNTKVDISIPMKINENLDILNSSSKYYNVICYTATSSSGIDIILKYRRNEFINGNKTVCQDGCIFSEYKYNIEKVRCSCDVQELSKSFGDIYINKDKLIENFINVKNIEFL